MQPVASTSDLLRGLLPGLWVTLQIYLGAAAIVVAITLALGVGRGSRRGLVRWACGLYIQAFRGLPALVLLFWFFYSLPGLGLSIGPRAAGILALGLNFGAYGAELMRGAIAAVPRGQTEAGVALSFSPAQRMRHVILPQALVHLLPPFGNLNIELLENTALVSFIGLADLTFQGKLLQTATQRTVEIFGLALVLYFLLASRAHRAGPATHQGGGAPASRAAGGRRKPADPTGRLTLRAAVAP